MSKSSWGNGPANGEPQWGSGPSEPSEHWGGKPEEQASQVPGAPHRPTDNSAAIAQTPSSPNQSGGGSADPTATNVWPAAPAAGQPTDAGREWTVTTAPAKSSKRGAILAAIVGVLVVAAIVAGWVYYSNGGVTSADNESLEPVTVTSTVTAESAAPAEGSESSTPSDPQAKAQDGVPSVIDPCDLDYLDSQGLGSYGAFDRSDRTPYYCDGKWLVNHYALNLGELYRWDNGWVEVTPDRSSPDHWGCVYRSTADRIGLAQPLYEKYVCPTPEPAPAQRASAPGFQSPACNGQYILIVESVIHHPYENKDALLNAALAKYPGASYTNPGQCSSLRARFDGGDVYPIYYSHGFDTASLCQQKARLGGNARSLNNAADFSDPC